MNRKIYLLIFLCISIFPKLHADTVLGGSLGYKFISASGENSTYRVTLELYTTCLFVANFLPYEMAGDAEIWVIKDGIRIARPLLAYKGNQDFTPVCPANINNTTCQNPVNPYISVIKYTYTADIELNGRSENWVFAFHGIMMPYARAELFKYLDNVNVARDALSEHDPFPFDLPYFEARLNNIEEQNNTPTFTSAPSPYFCKGTKAYYSMGAADPDFDEMKFSLVTAQKTTNSYNNPIIAPVIYYPPYTGDKPLPVTPDNFYLNPSNGQIIFTPNQALTCLVTMQVDEFRRGKVVGSSVRLMTFMIDQDCNVAPPSTLISNITNADYVTDAENNLYLSACEGLTDTVSFDIDVTDPNNNNVIISSNNLPTAATVTIVNNSTQNPKVHFQWNLTEAIPTTYFFHLTYTDDGCPMESSKNIAYNFTVIPHNIKFQNGSSGSCVSVTDGKAWVNPIGENTIDYTYKWVATSTGNVLRNVSSKVGDTLSNVPPGVYKVYVRNSEGCGKNIFVTVDTTFLPKLDLPNDTTLCKGMYQAVKFNPEPATTYQWNNGFNECCFKIKEAGTYILNATNHCGTSTASVNVDVVKCNYCFFVPNAFTPNGDGNNDVFKITPTCLTTEYMLFIYNRWGQLVFKSYNLENSWDGSYNGQEAQMGTYNYVLESKLENPEQEDIRLTGTVDVIK